MKYVKLLALLVVFALFTACTPVQPSNPSSRNPVETPADKPGKGDKKEPTPTVDETKKAEAEELEKTMTQADLLSRGYFYDEAVELLLALPNKTPEVTAKVQEIQDQKAKLVKYEGLPYHVFFHSLILFPELAFDNVGHSAQGYNMWMTTRTEFIKMLPQLQERGFILYDIEQLLVRNPDGTVTKKDIYLPEGKKPLVISVDDVNYYDYMRTDGFANRLLVDEHGKLATEVVDPAGNAAITYDGDVAPLLNTYVEEHPEFSYRGAKGILAVTGYEGAFGYRITDLEGAELEAARAEVKKIADTLYATGWKIANHSYTHNGYFSSGKATMNQLVDDTQKWKKHIAPYVGDPKIYISPFGWHMKQSDARFKYLVEQGYDIYCPVEKNVYLWFDEVSVIQPRFNLDGYSMFKRPDYVNETFFDVSQVIDPARPTPNW